MMETSKYERKRQRAGGGCEPVQAFMPNGFRSWTGESRATCKYIVSVYSTLWNNEACWFAHI